MPRLPFTAILLLASLTLSADPAVRTMRVPDGGIQPQAAVDSSGVVHLIYFKGEAAHGDIYYVRSKDGGKTFSAPLQVNSVEASAIAIGTIRGAQMAIGKANRIHVAWNGSDLATPKAAGGGIPMLYTRLNDASDAFEPQRNLITQHIGLDGGGSVAADQQDNVYVAWHAPDQMGAGEASRRVWIARSSDAGKTFAPETATFEEATGACGCCGMKLFAGPDGSVFALYRSATEKIHRDMYLLRSDDRAGHFKGADIAPMEAAMCVMSSAAMTSSSDAVLTAWETMGQIYWAKVSKKGAVLSKPIAAPGPQRGRKHPAVVVNASGDVLLGWTEGTGWNKGGSIAWQVYHADGKPLAGGSGRADGLAVWSLPAAFADAAGGFTVVY